jgi:hypothetical protein
MTEYQIIAILKEAENHNFKQTFAELSLKSQFQEEIIKKL